MNNLHLSVLNEGERYQQLRSLAMKLHSGEWYEWEVKKSVQAVCTYLARVYATRLGDPMSTSEEIDACVIAVLDWHAARIAEEPPKYEWQVTRDNGHVARFMHEQDAFAYVLNCQWKSVHYATTRGGWRIDPINGPE